MSSPYESRIREYTEGGGDGLLTAISETATQPVHLLRLGFLSEVTLAAEWDADISWNSTTWSASSVGVRAISAGSARLEFPAGDDDAWLALILNEGVRNKTVDIYEHHTSSSASPQSDAVLIFSGFMDAITIDERVVVTCVERSTKVVFPPEKITTDTFTYLLSPGDVVEWGGDVLRAT